MLVTSPPQPDARTIVGSPDPAAARKAASRTLVGGVTIVQGTPVALGGTSRVAGSDGGTSRIPPNPPGSDGGATDPAARKAASRTLVGVARPGIAPLSAGVPPVEPPQVNPPTPVAQAPREPDPPGYQPARELGATLGADALAEIRPSPKWEEDERRRQKRRRAQDLGAALPKKRAVAPAPKDDSVSRRAMVVVIAAGGLALAAVLVAVFWPSPPPLTARPRADAGGREGVELTCKSCPDGTRLSIAGAAATVSGAVALVPLPAALSVGENRLKVEIDRPANGRDETVGVMVHVAYRIRPDLAALQAERPAFQITVEASSGTTVTIDGQKLPLAAGRGVSSIDVSEVCTGLANDVKTLARQIPYTVTPDGGPAEQGVVNVSIGIVPLHLDAPVAILPTGREARGVVPDPHVITDGPSFVLAGWTMKGAEVLAAGRPITVHADGSFAQVMNVSSVGATQIEVRARMPGMAPRLSFIKVRRVESLDKAARDIESGGDPRIGYRELSADIAGSVGKAVTLSGEVVEVKKQGYQTVMLLDVDAASGCPGGACTVRLVQGADNAARRGDRLRVFGHVARAFSVPGRPDLAEVEVDFTLRGEPGKDPK